MYEKSVLIKNKVGLHSKPVAEFVQKANEYKCSIKVIKDNNTANGKSLLSLLALDVQANTTLKISANGVDEEQAVEKLVALIQNY